MRVSEHVKQSPPETLEDVVNRYGRRLYSVSLRILRNRHDAEDAVQEACLKAFQSINSFRGEGSVYSWLYRIVQNESLTKLRQRRRTTSLESCHPYSELGSDDPCLQDFVQSPDLSLRTEQLVEFLNQCVDELPETYRRVYVLKDLEKLSQREVCEILRTPETTMKTRAYRARLVVRKRVKEHFFTKA